VTGVVIFALPIYYAWKLVMSFRRRAPGPAPFRWTVYRLSS
jgi:hypothetical protein